MKPEKATKTMTGFTRDELVQLATDAVEQGPSGAKHSALDILLGASSITGKKIEAGDEAILQGVLDDLLASECTMRVA